MQDHSLFTIYTNRLNKLNLDYIVTGSVAGVIYGEPRLTMDVDIIIYLRMGDVNRLLSLFPEDEFYIPPAEIIKSEVTRGFRGHFNIIHHETGFKADMYLVGNDPLHIFAFKNKKLLKIENEDVYFAPPEYVIIRKLQFYEEGGSEKHIRDIKSILQNNTLEIDVSFIKDTIKKQKILDTFNTLFQ